MRFESGCRLACLLGAGAARRCYEFIDRVLAHRMQAQFGTTVRSVSTGETARLACNAGQNRENTWH